MSAGGEVAIPTSTGVHVARASVAEAMAARDALVPWLAQRGLRDEVLMEVVQEMGFATLCCRLSPRWFECWVPGYEATGISERLSLDVANRPVDLELETLIAMLGGPVAFVFPSVDEFLASVAVRCHIVDAARCTALAFHTSEAERPADCWIYEKGRGFTILPGTSLIDALRKATQPELTGQLFSFSCYRATEYVILLGIAKEALVRNPDLYRRLQQQWETSAVQSGRFHEVFLREYGSMEAPLPLRYFVPGDRTWFRNPDDSSSDVVGYEGSWVMYLGGGLFTNFWKRDQPYTLEAKCLEIHHWRHATRRDEDGTLTMDETRVEALVEASMHDAADRERILAQMLRRREPAGVYRDGGCIDTSREYPRLLHPDTSDIVLPDAG